MITNRSEAVRRFAEYRELRDAPVWKLLAANTGPLVLAVLETRFPPGERVSASAAMEAVERDLGEFRILGEAAEKNAQSYLSDWLAAGYLERRSRQDEQEEYYELSASAAQALRFASGLLRPREAATESRLWTVIHQIRNLAEHTDPNPETRLAALRAERDAIEERMRRVETDGAVRVLDRRRALERVREIISLSSDLIADFSRVSAEFESLNRDLRQRLAEGSERRGEVLESLFAGIDIIADSDAGRSFEAFWRMLMDSRQRGVLDDTLELVLAREFAHELAPEERDFLRDLSAALLDRGYGVNHTQERLARSLRDFVRSREFREQKRLAELLHRAHGLAVELADRVPTHKHLGLELELTSAVVKSFDQWRLKDPAMGYAPKTLKRAEEFRLDPEELADQIRWSEIDFRTLKERIAALVGERGQSSVKDFIDHYGADQGLGTVLGLLDLGYRHGEISVSAERETVEWTGTDGCRRRGSVPLIYFIKERVDELE